MTRTSARETEKMRNARICCRCQWLMSPTNCCVQTRAWFTQKWCIINAMALCDVCIVYVPRFFYHTLSCIQRSCICTDINFSLYFFFFCCLIRIIVNWFLKFKSRCLDKSINKRIKIGWESKSDRPTDVCWTKSHEVCKNNYDDDFEWRKMKWKRDADREVRACIRMFYLKCHMPLLKHFKHAKWPFVPLTWAVSMARKKLAETLIYGLLYSFNSHSTEVQSWLYRNVAFNPLFSWVYNFAKEYIDFGTHCDKNLCWFWLWTRHVNAWNAVVAQSHSAE